MAFLKKLKKDIEEEDSSKKKKKGKKKPSSSKKDNKDWLKEEGQLAVDVYQNEDEFCVQAPIAGVDPEDIDVAIENEMLVIRGERKEPDAKKDKNYFYQECFWGPFSRQIILPEDANTEKIDASFEKGVLMVTIPKKDDNKKKKVSISVK